MNDYIYYLVALYVIFEAIPDANLLDRGYFIHEHSSRYFRRALVVISFAVIQIPYIGWYNFAIKLFSYSFLFASVFDQVLNILRGNYLFHLGRTASWDKFWRNHKYMYIVFTILAFILSIYLNSIDVILT